MLSRALRPLCIHSRTFRIVLLFLTLPCVYFGGASGAFVYRQRAENEANALARMPREPAPSSRDRLQVFAPHSDDETLGCAGRMEQTLEAGGAAQAVILSNGDGYAVAAENQTRQLRAAPADYVQLATLRQGESERALTILGLPTHSTVFLGYPDRGLMTLWNRNWTPDRPFTSPYTRCSSSPYPNTFHKSSCYCGQDLLNDIKDAMRRFRPTLITVTHPSDDHSDHVAASAFVTRALQELQADPQEIGWARKARLEYYIIHRGDWPFPQGDHPAYPLLPPAALAHLDTTWRSLPLTPQQTQRKAESIAHYNTQVSVMPEFMAAFARQSELFGEMETGRLSYVAPEMLRSPDASDAWNTITPVLIDAGRDSVLRDLQGGGDIRALSLCRDDQHLYVRLTTRQPIGARFSYTLYLRTFGPRGISVGRIIPLVPFTSASPQNAGIVCSASERDLEAVIPWSFIAPAPATQVETLAVSVETHLAGVEIDKTGVRFLTL